MTDANLDTEHSRVTTNHRTIRQWVEKNDGSPAVEKPGGKGITIPRILFPGDSTDENSPDSASSESDKSPVSWRRWFDAFESGDFAFAYQERTADGDAGRFYKLVDRTTAREHA
ncbi:hypothetical protein ACFFQF_07950 [Haladaptatus pallidirubidus]|uniref:Uncharacterized protein n=1 Tax=Haladaptatus pallidirubidus TaxID=1008152 RepID=A0AAV3UGS5_9EURY|nr:hypothetical protein [Haladaptatus pallidirubidus]